MSGSIDTTSMSGSELREKFETTLGENAQLRTKVAALEAGQLISEKGFQFVQADDLVSVDAEKREEVAAKLESERQAASHEQTRSLLKTKGFTDEQIADIIGDEPDGDGGGVAPDADAEKHARMADARSLAGSPVIRPSQDTKGLHFEDAIAAGIKV